MPFISFTNLAAEEGRLSGPPFVLLTDIPAEKQMQTNIKR